MDQSQEMSSVEKESLASEVMGSVGEPNAVVNQDDEATKKDLPGDDELPLAAKARLGRQEKRHLKEMRQLKDQINELHSRIGTTQNNVGVGNAWDNSPLASQPQDGGEEERIRRAVTLALNHKEETARQQKQQEDMAHINRQYQKFSDHLDKGSDKYDDFDDVVRSDDAPFTPYIRDAAALFIDNPAETLYTLGKDRDKLKQISQLHPQEQMREVIKLSHALLTGAGNNKTQPQTSHSPLGTVKASGMTSRASVNESTPVSEIREKMRSGIRWGNTKRPK